MKHLSIKELSKLRKFYQTELEFFYKSQQDIFHNQISDTEVLILNGIISPDVPTTHTTKFYPFNFFEIK